MKSVKSVNTLYAIISIFVGRKKVTGYLPFTPKRYISTYPRDKQERIWTIQKFVQYVKDLEGDKIVEIIENNPIFTKLKNP